MERGIQPRFVFLANLTNEHKSDLKIRCVRALFDGLWFYEICCAACTLTKE